MSHAFYDVNLDNDWYFGASISRFLVGAAHWPTNEGKELT